MQEASIVANAAGGHKDPGVSSKFKKGSNGYSIAIYQATVRYLNASHSRTVNSVSGLKVDSVRQQLIRMAMDNGNFLETKNR